MVFKIRMGLPEMEALWKDLSTRKPQAKLDRDEEKFFKKLVKALGYLEQNPRHNSLASHEIDDLTRKYGFKVFQSYLENATPAAGRLFWAYGPDKGDITVLAVVASSRRPETRRLPAHQTVHAPSNQTQNRRDALTMPKRQKPPEIVFQEHIADYLVREHKYGVLEQTAITDTEHFIAENNLWSFLKAGQADTLKNEPVMVSLSNH